MQPITPFLWFDHQAEEAARFYVSVFKNSRIGSLSYYGKSGSEASGVATGKVMTVAFELEGQHFTALNGGPVFPFTPALSLFVSCSTKESVDSLFAQLSSGGQILMPLDVYPFSERYAFFKDKYGVAWQLMLSPGKNGIAPSLLFVGASHGKAEEAVHFYTSVFKHAYVDHIHPYEKEEGSHAGTVKHASFVLEGQEFMAMDGVGEHAFGFNESMSFVVSCETQDEIDFYWNNLSSGGKPGQCGWLTDKFGISWQIVPNALGKLMSDGNKDKAENVMKAMLQMKKIDIAKLTKAYDGE